MNLPFITRHREPKNAVSSQNMLPLTSTMQNATSSDDELINEISNFIAEHITDWYGSGAKLLPYRNQRVQRLSLILRYRVELSDTSTVNLLAKIACRPYIKHLAEAIALERLRQLTQAEFRTLCQVEEIIHTSSASDRLTAIHPVAYLEQWNALVMEELPSIALRSLVLKPFVNRKQLIQAFEKAGLWLRLFHNANCSEAEVAFDSTAMSLEITRTIQSLQALGINNAALAQICEQSIALATQLQRATVSITRAHGDYHLGNLLLGTDNRVAVIDLDQSSIKPVYADIAELISDLLMTKKQLLTHGLLVRDPIRSQYERAFISSYFDNRSQYKAEMLSLFCVSAILRKWLAKEREFASKPALRSRIMKPLRFSMRHYFLGLAFEYINTNLMK